MHFKCLDFMGLILFTRIKREIPHILFLIELKCQYPSSPLLESALWLNCSTAKASGSKYHTEYGAWSWVFSGQDSSLWWDCWGSKQHKLHRSKGKATLGVGSTAWICLVTSLKWGREEQMEHKVWTGVTGWQENKANALPFTWNLIL